jgi:hypothetical protein
MRDHQSPRARPHWNPCLGTYPPAKGDAVRLCEDRWRHLLPSRRPAAPAEFLVVNLIAEHDVEPHEQFPGNGDDGFGAAAAPKQGEVVTFGRARLRMSPETTGSSAITTRGIMLAILFRARPDCVVSATMISGLRRTSSVARWSSNVRSPPATRISKLCSSLLTRSSDGPTGVHRHSSWRSPHRADRRRGAAGGEGSAGRVSMLGYLQRTPS